MAYKAQASCVDGEARPSDSDQPDLRQSHLNSVLWQTNFVAAVEEKKSKKLKETFQDEEFSASHKLIKYFKGGPNRAGQKMTKSAKLSKDEIHGYSTIGESGSLRGRAPNKIQYALACAAFKKLIDDDSPKILVEMPAGLGKSHVIATVLYMAS